MSNKIVVEFAKMTNTNGTSDTVVAIPFTNKIRYFPDPDTINRIIPEIETFYQLLIQAINSNPTQSSKYITIFFKKTDQFAIGGLGLIKSLSSDLNLSNNAAFQMVLNSEFIVDRIKYLQKEFRKSKKDNSIKYLESCHQLIDLFGFQNTLKIFKKNDIKMGTSTLQALYKVSLMPPPIKELISNGELLLTAAFEIPQIDEEKQIEMARAMKNKNYSDARKVAKHFQY
jgi:hypothetical protein